MNGSILLLGAFVAGVFLALQGGFNGQLAMALKSPLWATAISFGGSTTFALCAILVVREGFQPLQFSEKVPFYLWFIGALFSATGIFLYYLLLPKFGAASVISLGLSGQIVFAALASHWGWFGFPTLALNGQRLFGILLMIAGVVLVNFKK